MIRRCGLNRLNQFASFLSIMIHFRNARQDAKLPSMLSLDDVLYSGLSLSQEDEQWRRRLSYWRPVPTSVRMVHIPWPGRRLDQNREQSSCDTKAIEDNTRFMNMITECIVLTCHVLWTKINSRKGSLGRHATSIPDAIYNFLRHDYSRSVAHPHQNCNQG
jgi:hypothetical protein